MEEEEDEEDEHWAPSPTASLLNALLDRSRHKLLVPSAGGSSSGVPAKKPRPDPLPAAAPSPPLPRKITALVALLEQGVAALTAPREADAPSSSDNDTVVEAVAGGIAHYITAMLLPSSSATLLVPVPLVALQELGRAVVGYLQPPQPHPSPLSSEVQNELIRLLAALLALEPAAAPAVNPPPSSWQLVEHVSQAITAAGDRCVWTDHHPYPSFQRRYNRNSLGPSPHLSDLHRLASLQPMTLLPATPPGSNFGGLRNPFLPPIAHMHIEITHTSTHRRLRPGLRRSHRAPPRRLADGPVAVR